MKKLIQKKWLPSKEAAAGLGTNNQSPTPIPSPSPIPESETGQQETHDQERQLHKVGIDKVFVPPGNQAIADIVLVHGLDGKSYGTWYHADSGTHWPSAFLSRDFDNCRVLSYGYDSRVVSRWGGVSTSSLAQHSETFVGRLATFRKETNSVCCQSYSVPSSYLTSSRKHERLCSSRIAWGDCLLNTHCVLPSRIVTSAYNRSKSRHAA